MMPPCGFLALFQDRQMIIQNPLGIEPYFTFFYSNVVCQMWCFFGPTIAAPHFLQRRGCTRHLLCPLSGKTDTHPKGGVERSKLVHDGFSQTPSGVVKWHVAAVGQFFHTIFSESCSISESVQRKLQVFTIEDSSQHSLMSSL